MGKVKSLAILAAAVTIVGRVWASPLLPQVYNPGFEEGSNGWGWMAHNGAQATFRSESSDPHSGKSCLVFANQSGVAPHVYGRFTQVVEVLPATQYEFSCWIRGADIAGNEGANHFTDWNSYQLNLPTGTLDWQKRTTTFKTKPGQYYLTIGLNIANKIRELAVDDISLRPIGIPITGDGVEASYLLPSRVIGHNASGYLGIRISGTADKVEAVISSGDQTVFAKKAQLHRGVNEVEWEWNSGKVPFGTLDCRITVLDKQGNVITTTSGKVEKADSPISAEVDTAEAKIKEFDALYARCKAKGIALDYQTVARTMLTQFLPYAREDVQKGHDWRAKFAAKDFMRSLDEGIAEMQAYLKDPSLAPNVRRFRTGKVSIDGISFIGDRVDSKGKRDRGPVFFCGHGAFGQVRRDMPRWQGYAVNIIQVEMGPTYILPSENEVNLKAAKDIAKLLDDAAKQNVRVDVLLSPHYFPQWALNKWPHLAKGGGGFIGYCIDAPEAKQVIEKFLRTVVPMLKDKPALNSFCLSNEPVLNNTAGMDNTKPMWAEYLKQVHSDVKTMNERFGTSYASFDDVPIPGNESYDAPQFYDYCMFNNERFASWHQWMAGVVKSMAPKVPVHAKVMSMALPHRFTVSWGCDPELFGQLSDINGNDCLIRGQAGGGWAIPWHTQNMSYDLQRSMAMKPVFNSENHPTDDRSTYYVAPEHFQTALWQGAIHGQGATTFWVWEHSFDPNSDLYGNVMDRPGCAQAVGTTCLDLNRFAEEVTALQKADAPVAIVFSIASTTRNAKYLPAVQKVYEALNFCGVRVDFISERQLAAGKGEEYSLIVFPETTHLPNAAFDVLTHLAVTTRLVVMGEAPQKDPYGHAFEEMQVKFLKSLAMFPSDADVQKQMWPHFMDLLEEAGTLPEVRVVDLKTGEPVWGVEWRAAEIKGRTLINIVNLTDKPVDVKIVSVKRVIAERIEKPIGEQDPGLNAVDLLSLGGKSKVKTLLPITPVLAEVKQ